MSSLIKKTLAMMAAALLLGFASHSFAGFAPGQPSDGSVAAGSSYDAVLANIANGGGVQGTLRGAVRDEGFAGTIVIDLYKSGQKVSTIGAFCTNINNDTYFSEKYNMSSEMADCKAAYVVSKYPPLLSFPGLSKAQANSEAIARQAAVWHFSDGYVTTGPADVKARTNAIIADADTNANCASLDKPLVLSVSPANQAVTAGVPASYTVTATRNGQPVAGLAVGLTTDVGTLSAATVTTDNMGQATFTVSSDTAVTANVTAIAHYAMPAGTVLLGLIADRQKLVLADSKYAAAGSAVADIGIASAVANAVFQPSSGGLTVNVFHDRNITGAKDADNEENLSGIKVTVYDSKNKSKGTLTTDVNGLVNFAGLLNDTYKVVYTLPANTLDTNNPDNRMSKTATAKTATVNDNSQSVGFGVVKMPFVKACVYEDMPRNESGKPVYYTPNHGQSVVYKDGVAVVLNKNGKEIGRTNGVRDADEKGLKGWLVKLYRKDGSPVLGAEGMTLPDGSAVVTFSRVSDFTVGGTDYYIEAVKTTTSQWTHSSEPTTALENRQNITLSASSYLDACVSGKTEVPLLGNGTSLTATATDQGVALSWVSEGAITLWRAQKDAQGKWVGIESLNPGHTVDAAGLLVDSNVSSGQTYYYAVESVSDAGEDSLYILETPVTAK
jgi:hypothetical protein